MRQEIAGALAEGRQAHAVHLGDVYYSGLASEDQEDLGPELGGKLAPVLTTGRVTAWWWGHEHRAMTFRPSGGVQYPRCLGNGGMPVLRDPALTEQGRTVADWESRRYIWSGLRRWARSGFVVIDLAGDTISVRYRDDDGRQVHRETVS